MVGVQYVEEGKTYKAAAVKKDGEWILPTPALKGDVVEATFDGWYKDAAFTNAFSTPTLNDTYYAKWSSITRNVNTANLNKMASADSTIGFAVPTATTPLTVTVNGTNIDSSNQQITLEYYDNEDLEKLIRALCGDIFED